MKNNWQETKLDKIALINPSIQLQRGIEYPFIEMADMNPGFGIIRAKQNKVFDGNFSKFQSGDTLMAKITPCLENGKIAQFRDDANVLAFGSTEFIVFREREGVSVNDYISYLLRSDRIRNIAIGSMTGASGRQRANLEVIRSIKIYIPSIKTQKKIASILGAYDDLIENNVKRIRILEEMAQKIYKEWFIDFKFPGYKKIKFKNTELGKIPQDWKIDRLGSFVEFQNGYPFDSSNYVINGKYKIVTIKNVQNGFFVQNTTDAINTLPSNLKDYHHLKDGDIIMSLTGNVGRVCLAYGDNYVLNQRVVKLFTQQLYYSYVYTLMRSDNMFLKLTILANRAAQQNLSPALTSNMMSLVPSEHCLVKFNTTCYPIIELMLNIYKKNDNLKQTRDLLLPKLISGDIDVEKLEIKN